MAHRSVHRATGQLVKTCDEISDPESSAAFTSTRSCSGKCLAHNVITRTGGADEGCGS